MTVDPLIADCRLPDFFVVGAPKGGTTSLYHYLKQHPEIFLPQVKEPHFFGADLNWRSRVIPRAAYPGFYDAAPPEAKAGDFSVFYLTSEKAAEEIAAACPEARIIVMLRDPMSMIPSLHRQALKTGDEIAHDLMDAMGREADRMAGQVDVDQTNPGVMEMLFYSQIARYAEQTQRYFDAFGQEAVKVVLFEDFAADPVAQVQAIQAHIGVDPHFEPRIERHNEGEVITNLRLWQMVKHPPGWARTLWRQAIPAKLRGAVLHKASKSYSAKGKPAPLSQTEKAAIRDLYAEDVARLAQMIDRDLGHWLQVS